MDKQKLKEELESDEGRQSHPYRDSMGIWTAGVGHNLEAHGITAPTLKKWQTEGIPDVVIDSWLWSDVEYAEEIARRFCPVFDELSDRRQRALVNMAFNLGNRIFGFKHFRDALNAGFYGLAAAHMLDSLWARQVGDRAKRLAEMIREG